MKLKCNLEKLKAAVSLADKMTSKNSTLPILNSLYIKTDGKNLKIRSTNLNVGIEIDIPASIEKEGVFVVKSDVLLNVCSNLVGQNDVSLSLENDNLTININKSTAIVKCFPPDEFPTIPTVDGENLTIDSKIFSEGIKSVYFAAATSDIKPEISSIFIYSENDYMYFVATDSFRLAEKKIKIKGISDISKILIPYKSIADITRVLDVVEGNINISFTRNQMSIFTSNIYFTTRLIDGGFPQYQIIIPKEEKTKLVVMKQDIINTLKLSNIFTDKFFQVVLNIDQGDKKINISSKNSDVGSVMSNLDGVIDGESIEVVFNLKYFTDAFQALHGDSVSISFTATNKPIVIKNTNDNSFLYLLMPTNR